MTQPQCKDVLHDLIGPSFSKYSHYGDALILINLSIMIVAALLGQIPRGVLKKSFVIGLFFVCIRLFMVLTTSCRLPDYTRNNRAVLSHDENDNWYMLSGHTINTLFITMTLWNSHLHWGWKYFSVMLSVLVCFSQASTREHYTVDILLSSFLAYLAYVGYIRC